MLELDFGARTPDGVALSDALAHLPVADQEVDLAGPPLLGRMAPGAGAHQP
jgi:hypothetical protein